MVDNIEKVKSLMVFESEDDFYYLQILMRKKENPQLGSNSRVIKNYYIKSIEHLDKMYPEIKDLCNLLNARAMFRLNKRSFYNTGFKAMVNMANTMANKDFKNLRSQYDKACGQGHNSKDKTWIIDVDNKPNHKITSDDLEVLKSIINSCLPKGDKVKATIPSVNGYHLITSPFNVQQLVERSADSIEVDIHKDNPTNLYIP
jgi:hypothetical protein